MFDLERTFEQFHFVSRTFERYEGGLCVAREPSVHLINVRNNRVGCEGYILEPGDGYIVTIFSEDGEPQMSDKPMRVFRMDGVISFMVKVELRGFPIVHEGWMGQQVIDYSPLGLTVRYEMGEVVRCDLDMHNRGVKLVYSLRYQ